MKLPRYHSRIATSEQQVLHILGQHDMVWCGILAPKNLPGFCCGASGGKEADFSAPNSAYCWSD